MIVKGTHAPEEREKQKNRGFESRALWSNFRKLEGLRSRWKASGVVNVAMLAVTVAGMAVTAVCKAGNGCATEATRWLVDQKPRSCRKVGIVHSNRHSCYSLAENSKKYTPSKKKNLSA